MDTDSSVFNLKNAVRSQPSGARSTAKCIQQVERGGVHQLDVTPKANANFSRVKHLAPGTAGCIFEFVLANCSMSSNQSGESEITKSKGKLWTN
jgi:hypothetical protein